MSEKNQPLNKIEKFQGQYRFLSNFWPARVTIDGFEYPSVENAYQASKTLDLAERNQFQTLGPGESKRVAKKLILRPDWDYVKLDVMETLLRQKFSHPQLKIAILATENAVLEEGNTWGDTFWGICRGKGENHLGRLLMKIRAELLEQYKL